ncbi:hypothetical protein PsYK624_081070 [Phanerochaete sordida]|uniref:Uncharacterized protein n=1 Tax=Phanerochaete sordida TaxID=48140 RepID=A0A9P3GC44_9APHY|nr:hypothetical protein PsYK624_081070 [Phanerochaete sordida]
MQVEIASKNHRSRAIIKIQALPQARMMDLYPRGVYGFTSSSMGICMSPLWPKRVYAQATTKTRWQRDDSSRVS